MMLRALVSNLSTAAPREQTPRLVMEVEASDTSAVQLLFEHLQSFDVDQNGFIDNEEFKMYLQAVGAWESEPAFTDDHWESSFPAICLMLGAPDSTKGMSLVEFTRYHERYREGQAEDDLAELAKVGEGAGAGPEPEPEPESEPSGESLTETEGKHLDIVASADEVGSIFLYLVRRVEPEGSCRLTFELCLSITPDSVCRNRDCWPACHQLPSRDGTTLKLSNLCVPLRRKKLSTR